MAHYIIKQVYCANCGYVMRRRYFYYTNGKLKLSYSCTNCLTIYKLWSWYK